MSGEEKVAMITRNLQEVLGLETIKSIVCETDPAKQRPLKVYWGTAPTGRPHIGYFVPMTKIGDLLRAGCDVTILFADLHAFLDNMKAPWDLLKFRTQYYEELIKATLKSVGVPLDRLHFVRGTDYELRPEFSLDVYKMSSLVTEHDAKKAGAEVVKQVEHPLLSSLLYPCLQALDEQYLDCDAEFGGVDQRKIFTFSEKYLPMLGYKKRAHLMNPMVPGLNGPKMSSSDADSKIDLLDDAAAVSRKVHKAFCEEGNVTENGLLSFAKAVIFPLLDGKEPLLFNRPEKYGGPISFNTYQELEDAFANKTLYPGDLKSGMVDAINKLLAPLREAFASPEKQALIRQAYPEAAAPAAAAAAPAAAAAAAPAGGKKAKQPQQPKKAAATAPRPIDISRANIIVGELVTVEKHPDADTLFKELVDLGPKYGKVTVVSGLANYMRPEDLQGKRALFLQNLKPMKMRGVESRAMILAGSSSDHTKVEVVFPDQETPVGERVTVEGHIGEPDEQFNPKKKVWEQIVPDFSTDAECCATWKGVRLMTSKGPCKVQSLVGCEIH